MAKFDPLQKKSEQEERVLEIVAESGNYRREGTDCLPYKICPIIKALLGHPDHRIKVVSCSENTYSTMPLLLVSQYLSWIVRS